MNDGLNGMAAKFMMNVAMRTLVMSAMLVLGSSMVSAQQPYRSPRGPDGHPNLSGIWQAMNTANWDLVEHAGRTGTVVAAGTLTADPGGPGVVEGGEIPYLPEALAQKKKNFEDRLNLDPEVRCYLPGIPRANYMPYPFQIFHTSKAIFFAYQYAGAVRNIYLKDPGAAPIDTWMGQPVGHWEGDSLVIDNTGFDQRTWFDRAGDFHSDALHVIERFTLSGPNILNYEATIEDKNVFSRPWKIRMPLYRHVEKDARLMEFKCVEFVEDLIYHDLSKAPGK